MWLEMSRDEEHGGLGWNFLECLWSPAYKRNNKHWGYWDLLLKVKKGDMIFHLRGKTPDAFFIGYSIAEEDGYKTNDKPPISKEWGYADSFFRVPLISFTPFADPINVSEIFDYAGNQLLDYYVENMQKGKENRELLFFVVQADRIQCQNGAYLSEFSDNLASIVFGTDYSETTNAKRIGSISIRTGEQIQQIKARRGQQEWSKTVRENYGNKCCFPGCIIEDKELLVASHIARWVDVPDLRGKIENGLCFCLLHDKAFENGIFTLSAKHRVYINPLKIHLLSWSKDNIIPFEKQRIKIGSVLPSTSTLLRHWERIGFTPVDD